MCINVSVVVYLQNAGDNMSEEQIKKIVENCKESIKEKDTKPTEEAYDKKFDFDDSMDHSNAEQSEMETNQSEEQQETESSKKNDKKERKKNKEKKEKKIKKEKGQKEKDTKMDDDENAPDSVYVPPASMLKETEMKGE